MYRYLVSVYNRPENTLHPESPIAVAAISLPHAIDMAVADVMEGNEVTEAEAYAAYHFIPELVDRNPIPFAEVKQILEQRKRQAAELKTDTPPLMPYQSINAKMYPISAKLAKDLAMYLAPDCPHVELYRAMVDNFLEYEHGAADVVDVAPGMTLKRYAAVLRDIVQSQGEW